MILFGPAGNSESFYNEGHKRTVEVFSWIREMGLNTYEYSFGRGVRLKRDTALAIGKQAAANNITLSVHAPYYINLATLEPEKALNNLRYLSESARAAKWMGAKRVVFHPGSQGRVGRTQAFDQIKKALAEAIEHLENEHLFDITICPETLGKVKQLGDLDEVMQLCKIDERIVPAIDFGHLHARGIGALNCESDFAQILDTIENELGGYRAKHFHVHFSKIEYTAQGEKRHRTFAEKEYGPDFAPLAKLIAQRGLEPVIICESKGTMAEDAVQMKRLYEQEIANL